MAVSKNQIDQLGERLRKGPPSEGDLRLLETYRQSFAAAFDAVIQVIQRLGENPTGRPAKSTPSIVNKLRRESLRLSQMQDIAGCRIVVAHVSDQDKLLERLTTDLADATVIDRRNNPSHGYRAVHFIARQFGKPIEIQIRTELQHLWAQLSEKISDVVAESIKYGGGPESSRKILLLLTRLIQIGEEMEATTTVINSCVKDPGEDGDPIEGHVNEFNEFFETLRTFYNELGADAEYNRQLRSLFDAIPGGKVQVDFVRHVTRKLLTRVNESISQGESEDI